MIQDPIRRKQKIAEERDYHNNVALERAFVRTRGRSNFLFVRSRSTLVRNVLGARPRSRC